MADARGVASAGASTGLGVGSVLAVAIHYDLYGLGGGVFWMAVHALFGWFYVIWALLAGKIGIF